MYLGLRQKGLLLASQRHLIAHRRPVEAPQRLLARGRDPQHLKGLLLGAKGKG